MKFLGNVVPERVRGLVSDSTKLDPTVTRDEFLCDVVQGMKIAPMAVRLTPHILSSIDWNDPINDPVRRQFIPLKSTLVPDHPRLTLDSLHEVHDSPVDGLVHRYPDKALFLGKQINPIRS